jgi:RimJ/RimL family protein N-acetyltransferase
VIETERLRLIPARPEHYRAMREGDAALGRLLEVTVAEGWEGLPDHRDAIASGDSFLAARPEAADWWTYLFVLDAEHLLVGVGGLKGLPQDGAAEIGYALAPACRGRGLAREAAQGLVSFALASPDVDVVCAHTLAEENRSTRLLQRLGMRRVEVRHDPEDGEIWRWEITREQLADAAAGQPFRDAQPADRPRP